MKVIQISDTGGPEVLKCIDLPIPKPKEHQVLIQTDSIGVSMPEIMVRKGIYAWMPPMPAIPGIEMSGRVIEVGSKVTTLAVGDPVFVSARELDVRGGCYAEYLCVDANAPYQLLSDTNLEYAACLSNYQVAWHLLNSATRGFRYDSILVWAASGGVGTAIIQLAKLANKTVIAIAGGENKCKFVKSLGADECINYHQEDVVEKVNKLTQSRLVDLVLDCVGGKDFYKNFKCISPLGLVVSYGQLLGRPDHGYAKILEENFGQSPGLRFFSMHSFDHRADLRRAAMDELVPLISQSKITPVIAHRIALADVQMAHQLFESKQVLGKIILKP